MIIFCIIWKRFHAACSHWETLEHLVEKMWDSKALTWPCSVHMALCFSVSALVCPVCVCADNYSDDEHYRFSLFSSRWQTCALTRTGYCWSSLWLSGRTHVCTHTHTHTLKGSTQSKLKAIVTPYGSCGSASQEACEESWRQSCGACWAVWMWSLSFWPQSTCQLWYAGLWAFAVFHAGCIQGHFSELQVQ